MAVLKEALVRISDSELDRLLNSLSDWLMGEAIPLPGRTGSDDQLAADIQQLAQVVGEPRMPREAVMWRGVNLSRQLPDDVGLVRTAGEGRRFQSWSTVRQAALAFARASVHDEDGEPGFGYLYEAMVAANAERILLSVPDVCSFLRQTGKNSEALDTLSMFEPSEEIIILGDKVLVESITAVLSPITAHPSLRR